jgi:hypothetical protein
MIHHRVEQGSGDWLKLHIGIPTASQFHRIVTPANWRLSKQARRYAFQLAAETLSNESTEPLTGIEAMERGKEMEPRAVQMYEFEQEVETVRCGFFTTDDGLIGASPDRLIVGATAAALEVKCPMARWVQLEYLIDGFGADYLPQAQGQIFVCELERCDRYAYHPGAPSVLVPTFRDEALQRSLRQALADFLDMRDDILERARRCGLFAERRRLGTAVDAEYGDLARLAPE